MIAVESNNHECVKVLLANGADVNAANTVGMPMHQEVTLLRFQSDAIPFQAKTKGRYCL